MTAHELETKRGRGHAPAGSRILVGGLATSATLGIAGTRGAGESGCGRRDDPARAVHAFLSRRPNGFGRQRSRRRLPPPRPGGARASFARDSRATAGDGTTGHRTARDCTSRDRRPHTRTAGQRLYRELRCPSRATTV